METEIISKISFKILLHEQQLEHCASLVCDENCDPLWDTDEFVDFNHFQSVELTLHYRIMLIGIYVDDFQLLI